jgi:hypothetical protein
VKLNGLTMACSTDAGVTPRTFLFLTCETCGFHSPPLEMPDNSADKQLLLVRAVLAFASHVANDNAAGCEACRKTITSAMRSNYVASVVSNPHSRRSSANVVPYGICPHCKRYLQLVGRGICMTCYRQPDVKALYPPRKTGRKPKWLVNDDASPEVVRAKFQEDREKGKKAKRQRGTRKSDSFLSLNDAVTGC